MMPSSSESNSINVTLSHETSLKSPLGYFEMYIFLKTADYFSTSVKTGKTIFNLRYNNHSEKKAVTDFESFCIFSLETGV